MDAQIADTKGFFKSVGIHIQWTGKQAHGPASLVTVAAGENDFAGTISTAVFLARLRGAKLKIIASQSASCASTPLYRYLVKDDGPIKGDPRDFIGTKVVASPATIGWYPLVVFLKAHGVDPDRVEYLSVGSPLASAQALKEGKVAAIASSDYAPPGSLLLGQGGYHFAAGIDDAAVLKLSQIGGWVAREDYLRDHPDTVRRFVLALTRAACWADLHPEEAEFILLKWEEVPPSLWKYYKWRTACGVRKSLKVDPKAIRRWDRILEEFGQLPLGSIRPEDVYTNEFIPLEIPDGRAP
jgi:ABC-type nitrate/sulfonate/bicarbonate transport system substrate-binding protein